MIDMRKEMALLNISVDIILRCLLDVLELSVENKESFAMLLVALIRIAEPFVNCSLNEVGHSVSPLQVGIGIGECDEGVIL
jgi:hypothetical protein